MKFTKHLAALGVAASMLMGATLPVAAADKLVITLDSAPGHLRTRMFREFVSRLEAKSGGALTFEVFDSNQLYSSRDAAKAVARGDAGMTILVTPYLSRIVPDFNVFDLPVLNGTTDQERAAMLDNGMGQALADQVEAKMDVIVPGKFWSMGKVLLFSTKRPMNTFADLKGMQVRIPGGAALVMRLDAVNAVAVSMPGADVPLALQQGVVDASMYGADSVLNNKLWDAGVQHGFWDQGIIGYLTPLVYKGYWDSLTDAEKAMFTETWNEVTMLQRQAILDEETQHWAQLAEHGIQIVTASDEDVAQANEAMLAIQDAMIEKLDISAEIVAMAVESAK